MQIQKKKASTPHHVHSTMQPPSKITVFKMYSCQYQPVKIINQKSGLCHQIKKKIFTSLWSQKLHYSAGTVEMKIFVFYENVRENC